MSAIVPWTDPGGTPCCCNPCYTDLENEPVPNFTLPWKVISNSSYAALYAGGVYTGSIAFNIVGLNIFGAQDGETHIGGGSVTFPTTNVPDLCFFSDIATESQLVNVQSNRGDTASYLTNAGPLFIRSLGNANGLNYVNLSTLNTSTSSWLPFYRLRRQFSAFWFGDPLLFYMAQISNSDLIPSSACPAAEIETQVDVTTSLTVDEETVLFTGGAYACSISALTKERLSHSGTFSLEVDFLPFAP